MDINIIENTAKKIPELLYKYPYRSFVELHDNYSRIYPANVTPFHGNVFVSENNSGILLYLDYDCETIRVFINDLFELSLDVRLKNIRPYIAFSDLLMSLGLIVRDDPWI